MASHADDVPHGRGDNLAKDGALESLAPPAAGQICRPVPLDDLRDAGDRH